MNRRSIVFSAIIAAVVVLGVAGYILLSRPAAPPVQTRTFDVTVTGTTPSTDTLDAYQGDTVVLTFTTDKTEEVHLHGYDIHFFCQAGVPMTKKFVARNAGTFEYELEATSTHLGNLVVNPR